MELKEVLLYHSTISALWGLLLLCLLDLQNFFHNLLLFNQEGSDDSFPDSACGQYTTVGTVYRPTVPGQSRPLVFSRSQVRNPLDSLSSYRTFGSTSSLLGALIHQLPSRGFDDPVLVWFGGVAVPFPIRESLNHLPTALSLSPSLPNVKIRLNQKNRL